VAKIGNRVFNRGTSLPQFSLHKKFKNPTIFAWFKIFEVLIGKLLLFEPIFTLLTTQLEKVLLPTSSG
jgi:hypothetical protein